MATKEERLQTKEIEQAFADEKQRQLAQPKVKLFIPKDPINPEPTRYVQINGVEYFLGVGKQIEVPECVAEVWHDSYTRTEQAKAEITTDIEIG